MAESKEIKQNDTMEKIVSLCKRRGFIPFIFTYILFAQKYEKSFKSTVDSPKKTLSLPNDTPAVINNKAEFSTI